MTSSFHELSPRIVLMACGSFSPPTLMHMRMFEIARDHIEMTGSAKVIGGIVSPTHDSYGKSGLAPAKHRLAMVKLALQSSNWIKLSDWECNQNQWSRTLQTLQYHQNYMNNIVNEANDLNQNIPGWLPDGIKGTNQRIKLKLLCGADLLESFSVPGLWNEEDIEDILSNFGMIVISRSGSNAEKFIFESDILTKFQTNITIVRNWVPNEVSSSMIRRLLRRGQSVKYLIDDLVLTYIQTQRLFDVKIPEYYLENYQKQLNSNRNYIIQNFVSNVVDNRLQNTLVNNEQMDEVDNNSSLIKKTQNLAKNNVFCCKEIDNTSTINESKFALNCPGQAVKIITNPLHVNKNDKIKQHQQHQKDHQRIIELNKANSKRLKITEIIDDGKLNEGYDDSSPCDKEAVKII